jgi:hypothetical protein
LPASRTSPFANNGKLAVWYAHVSPTYSDQREGDILGDDTLPANTELNVRMNGDDECMFDIKIVDEKESTRAYHDVDLCCVLYVDFP